MSRLALDHVVIRVNDLEEAIRDYSALGFTVVRGGEHPGLGSRNALIAFEDDTYLELITFARRPEVMPKAQRAQQLAAEGRSPLECRFLTWESSPEGLVDFALVPSDIDEVLQRARQAGLKMEGPIPGSRLRPDGQKVAWNLGIPDGFDLPFLCADVTPRELRVPTGEARRHANGVKGTIGLAMRVINLPKSQERYQMLLGTPATSEATWRGEEVAGAGFLVASSSIQLMTPSLTILQPFDEKPFILALRVLSGEFRYLSKRTHGAVIQLNSV